MISPTGARWRWAHFGLQNKAEVSCECSPLHQQGGAAHTDWLVGWLLQLSQWESVRVGKNDGATSVVWLVDRLTGWFIDWLVGWLLQVESRGTRVGGEERRSDICSWLGSQQTVGFFYCGPVTSEPPQCPARRSLPVAMPPQCSARRSLPVAMPPHSVQSGVHYQSPCPPQCSVRCSLPVTMSSQCSVRCSLPVTMSPQCSVRCSLAVTMPRPRRQAPHRPQQKLSVCRALSTRCRCLNQ